MPHFSALQWLLLLAAGACITGWLTAWTRLADLLRPDRPKYTVVIRQWMFEPDNYTDPAAATRAMWAYRGWSIALMLALIALLRTI